VNLKHQLID